MKARVGILGHLSGRFSPAWRWFQQGVEAYQRQNGSPFDLVYRDVGTSDAAAIRRTVEELDVSVLAGFYLSGDAIAAAPAVDGRRIPAVLFNAASHTVLGQSRWFVRVGSSIWQFAVPAADWAYRQGRRRAYVAVADNLPGHDIEQGFTARFTALGGTLAGAHRMPSDTQDFAPHVARMLAAVPDVIHVFVATRIGLVPLVNSLARAGAFRRDIAVVTLGNDTDIDLFDEAALGCYSVNHYAPAAATQENRAFRLAVQRAFGAQAEPISSFTVEGYDGMHVAARLLEPGEGVEAVRGYAWESPRGPVCIEADTRDITQNIYIRRLDRIDGRRQNVVVETFPSVKDPWLWSRPAPTR